MTTITVIGAFLVALGILYLAASAIFRGRLTEPHSTTRDPADVTLEPRQTPVRFLSPKSNWPGLVAVLVGALLLLAPVL